MPPKKLAIIGVRGIPARYGGFETFAEELSTRLVQHGIDVTVFCERSEKHSISSYKGVKIEYLSVPFSGVVGRFLYEGSCILKSLRRFDIVYLLGYGSSLLAFLPRCFGTKVWLNPDGLEWKRAKWSGSVRLGLRALESMAMVTPDLLVIDSKAVLKNLKTRYPAIPDYRIIEYGAYIIDSHDESILDGYHICPNDYYLVVSRLEPENHVLEILQGFSESNTSSQLVVVGDTSIDTDYVKTLTSADDNRIVFIGSVYDKPKLSALRFFSQAYFHGHSVGGTNPSLLESLGCGNLIIAHDNEFNREVAEDSALYFARSEDIPGIISYVESLSTPEVDKFREKARDRIILRYNW